MMNLMMMKLLQLMFFTLNVPVTVIMAPPLVDDVSGLMVLITGGLKLY